MKRFILWKHPNKPHKRKCRPYNCGDQFISAVCESPEQRDGKYDADNPSGNQSAVKQQDGGLGACIFGSHAQIRQGVFRPDKLG